MTTANGEEQIYDKETYKNDCSPHPAGPENTPEAELGTFSSNLLIMNPISGERSLLELAVSLVRED